MDIKELNWPLHRRLDWFIPVAYRSIRRNPGVIAMLALQLCFHLIPGGYCFLKVVLNNSLSGSVTEMKEIVFIAHTYA